MLPLEKIADDPLSSSISELLILATDPLGDFGRVNGPLTSGQKEDIIVALKEHFAYGGGLIKRFEYDRKAIEFPRGGFNVHQNVPNTFELLRAFLEHRPREMDKKMASLYRKHESEKHESDVQKAVKVYGKEGPTGLEAARWPIDPFTLLLLHFTHEWHHFVYKGQKYSPFDALKGVPEGVDLWLPARPDVNFPKYAIGAWMQRVKSRQSIKDKILYKIFTSMEDALDKQNLSLFYNSTFVDDYFGVKAIGSGQLTMGYEPQIKGLVKAYLDGMKSPWLIASDEKYRETKAKEGKFLSSNEYLLKPKEDKDTPVQLQLQVVTNTLFLLEHFFSRDAHQFFKHRRLQELQEYKREYPHLYGRMEASVDDVLSFLQK